MPTIVPYGLVLTALSLDDAIKKRAELNHRRRNGNQIHTLKVFASSLVVITTYCSLCIRFMISSLCLTLI